METAGSFETFVPGCLTMWHQILMSKKENTTKFKILMSKMNRM